MTHVTEAERIELWKSSRGVAKSIARQYGIDADDLMQVAWFSFQNADVDTDKGDPMSLLATILKRRAVDEVRKQNRRPVPLGSEAMSGRGDFDSESFLEKLLVCSERATDLADQMAEAEEAAWQWRHFVAVWERLGWRKDHLALVMRLVLVHGENVARTAAEAGVSTDVVRAHKRDVFTICKAVQLAAMNPGMGVPELLERLGTEPDLVGARIWRLLPAPESRWTPSEIAQSLAAEMEMSESTVRQYAARARRIARAARCSAELIEQAEEVAA